MKENAKFQDGGDKTLLISILKLNKLHVLLYVSTYKLRVKISWYVKKNLLLFRLIFYVLYSFRHTFSTFYIRLLFTRTMAWVNLLSTEYQFAM